MKKTVFLFFLLGMGIKCLAQPPGYYSSALGKNGAQLKTSLHNIIDNHNSASFPLWAFFNSTDNKGNNILWDIYSDQPGGTPNYSYTIGTDQCGQYNSEGDCYNHEHLWPKTYFNDASPMRSDLHHIYPVDGWVNNKRGSLPFGEVSSTSYTSTNGSKIGSSNSYSGYNGDVFQPIEDYRGDIARVMFYMSTRYEGEDNSWTNWIMANKAVLKYDAIQLLLKWHHDDSVSQKEIDRNNAIYSYQNNRNPFIDYPVFVDCIWGTTDCTPLSISDYQKSSLRIFPNPTSDYINIEWREYPEAKEVVYQIYNHLGQQLLEGDRRKMKISHLPNGIYELRIISDNLQITKSFIKQ